MYTGCITEIGTVIETGSRLVIEAPKTVAGLAAGGSVNINGTCLSAIRVDCETGRFEVEVSAETAKRSALGDLAPGGRVNLELPLR